MDRPTAGCHKSLEGEVREENVTCCKMRTTEKFDGSCCPLPEMNLGNSFVGQKVSRSS